jgi:hypothetical protein
VTETPDDLVEPEEPAEPAEEPLDDDVPVLSAEESLGLLPAD